MSTKSGTQSNPNRENETKKEPTQIPIPKEEPNIKRTNQPKEESNQIRIEKESKLMVKRDTPPITVLDRRRRGMLG